MRILFWSESFWPRVGGIEVLAARFVSALRARGHEVQVVTRKDSDQLADVADFDGVPVRRFPLWTALAERNPGRLLEVSHAVAALKLAFRPDLIHLNAVQVGAFFHHQTLPVHPAPTLVTLHGTVEERFSRPGTVLESTLRSAAWITTCSSAVLVETRRQFPELARCSSAIPNSLETPAGTPEPLPFDPPHLLCVGRLVRPKGFDLALAALSRLVERSPAPRLLLAGDGPERPRLEQQARALGLSERVEFLGWVAPEDIPKLINRATVVVVPSREESYGLVALQAAQMARPVVATWVGGLPEIVRHGSTGLLVESEQGEVLAAAIERLLDSPETAVQMGQLARQRVQRLFGWNEYLEAYESLYRRLAQEGRYASVSVRQRFRTGSSLRGGRWRKR
jgi:glycogen(starch) synthase